MKRLILLLFLLQSTVLLSQNFNKQEIKNRLDKIDDKLAYSRLTEEQKILLSKELYDFSREENDKRGMLIALVKYSSVLINQSNTNEALKAVDEGLLLAKELNESNYYSFLLEVKARSLTFAKNFDGSRYYYSQALRAAEKIDSKDKLHLRKVSLYTGLTDYSMFVEQVMHKKEYTDSILYFANKAYEEAKKIPTESSDKYLCMGQALRSLGSINIYLGNIQKGEHLLDEAEQFIVKSNDPTGIAGIYAFRGDAEYQKKNYKKALNYFDKALEISDNTGNSQAKLNIYPRLIDFYKQNGDLEKQLYYTEKSQKLNDSLATINQYALITQSKIDKKNLLSGNQVQKTVPIWYFIAIGGLLILFILIGVFIIKRRKNNAKSELTAGEIPGTNAVQPEKLAVLMDLAKNNDKHFFLTFQETFPELYQRLLGFEELNPSDIELCAFLKLNLQTKEIANYKKSSIGAIDNRKYRLRKKLNLSQDVNLYNWINTI